MDRRLTALESRQISSEKRIEALEQLVLQLREEIRSAKAVPDSTQVPSPTDVKPAGVHAIWSTAELCPSRKLIGEHVNMMCEDGVIRHGNAFEDGKGRIVLLVHAENGIKVNRPSTMQIAAHNQGMACDDPNGAKRKANAYGCGGRLVDRSVAHQNIPRLS